MSRGDISPRSSSTISSSTSLDSPLTVSRQDLLNNGVAAISSIRSDGAAKTRTIAVAIKAHKEMKSDPFVYAFNHLVEQKNCRVVVICCLSRLQDEMGVDHVIDVEKFGGINNRKLEAVIATQDNNINHFLRTFRSQLEQKGVQLDIRIIAGPKSGDCLVQAAQAIHPHWVVLDKSFSGHHREIQERLQCNLVLMRRYAQPLILQLTTKFLVPIDQLNADDHSLDYPTSENFGTPATSIQTTVQLSDTKSTATSNSKVFTFCMCFSNRVSEEGPKRGRSVLYGNETPGSKVAYIGQLSTESTKQEVVTFSSKISSPASSPAPWFSRSSPRKSVTKSVRIIEQEMEASMAKQQEEEDFQEYRVQL